jgi:hypothetical protein
MKVYKIEVELREQSDEWFEEITAGGNSGCDEVLKAVRDELQNYDVDVRLIEYNDK